MSSKESIDHNPVDSRKDDKHDEGSYLDPGLCAPELRSDIRRQDEQGAALSPAAPLIDTPEPQGKSRKKKEITEQTLERLLDFDRQVLKTASPRQLVEVLIGTDEVGRGCLAGPVVAAAVVMPAINPGSQLALQITRLNDSKMVPPAHRAELANILRDVCQWAIGEASVEEIDDINILNASLLAMRRAIRRLKIQTPALIAVDGNKKIRTQKYRQVTVIGGDGKSATIAAASIIAKVHRDTLMCTLAESFPQYLWQSNKGYGSKEHLKAINQYGLTPWHRRSFCDHRLNADDSCQS